MKKILLVLVLCLSTIGLAGCGNSAPTTVTLDPKNGDCQKLEVGKDIAEGTYTIDSDEDFSYEVATQGSAIYDVNNNMCGNPDSRGGLANPRRSKTVNLSKGEYLFIEFRAEVTLSQN